jgi:diguanylate cyclase (GGDEF)-like protein
LGKKNLFEYMFPALDGVFHGMWVAPLEGSMRQPERSLASMGNWAAGESTVVRHTARHRLLRVLAYVAVLALPIAAYATGVYTLSWSWNPGRVSLVSAQTVLLLATVLVSAAGGFLIWSTATSMARATEVEARLGQLNDTLSRRLGESAPLVNSFTRMLATIERQTDEINQFTERLGGAYQEIEAAKARLEEVSFTDELTRLYNRRFFSMRLEEETDRYRRFGHPFSLVLLDLDGFKQINDELGHVAGDETLRAVADLLLKNSRAIDVISRYGGDEFAILLVETPRAVAFAYAERIRARLSACSLSHGRQLTASLGTVCVPMDAVSADALFRAADEALYAAKRAGKNRVAVGGGLDRGASPVPEVAVR